MKNMTDADLIPAVRAGDGEAFQTLYYRYAKRLFAFLWRRTGHRETAEDLLQEVFIRVWNNRQNLDPAQSIQAYLYRAAHHLAIDHLRKKVSEGESISPPTDLRGRDFRETGFEERDRLRKAIEALPEKQGLVFRLSREEGLKYAEIAGVMKISVKTVEAHMNKALKKLRQSLHDLATLIFFAFFHNE